MVKRNQSSKIIVVEQVASPIRRPAVQRTMLTSLGLNKMRRRRILQDTPTVRGLISRIQHLVRIVNEH